MTLSFSTQDSSRVAALHEYNVLDAPLGAPVDRLLELALHLFEAPKALVSFLDNDREWIGAGHDVARRSVSLENGFGAHVLKSDGVLVVEDAAADARFKNHAMVSGDPGIRFYAGAPLITPENQKIGTIAWHQQRNAADATVGGQSPRGGLD